MSAKIKLLTDYLDRAVNFERMAAAESGGCLRNALLEQARAYRKLAAKRADELGLPPPSEPAPIRSADLTTGEKAARAARIRRLWPKVPDPLG